MVFFKSQGDCWNWRLSSGVSWQNWALQNEDGEGKFWHKSSSRLPETWENSPLPEQTVPFVNKGQNSSKHERDGVPGGAYGSPETQRDGNLEPSLLCTASPPSPQPAEGCTPKAKLAACWLGTAPVGLLRPDLTCLILFTHWKKLAS